MARRPRLPDDNAASETEAGGDRNQRDPVGIDSGEDELDHLEEEGDGDTSLDVDLEPLTTNEAIHFANARDGLNIRSGPGVEFPVIRSLPLGTRAHLIKREGGWGLIDELGDGAADGFVHLAFLNEQTPIDIHPATILAADQIRAFWGQRNPRVARLYDRSGNPLVDPKLLHASAIGVEKFEAQNHNYRIEMYGPGGGFRTRGSVANHGAQPGSGRGAAMDVVVIDRRTNDMLTNHPGRDHQHQGSVGENAPIYQIYYNEVVRAGSQLFPRFEEMARFGGYFATGDNAMDTMHIDMRGLVAPMGGGSLKDGFTNRQMRKWAIPENHPYR